MHIVIIEPRALFRESLRRLALSVFGSAVVEQAGDGAEAIEMVRRAKPNLVTLELALGEPDGFAVIEELGRDPKCRILVISEHCDVTTVWRLSRLPITGFLDKETATEEALTLAMAAASRGHAYFSPRFLDVRLNLLTDRQSFTKTLSNRELAVLALVGRGFDDDEIGRALGIAPRTAQTHRANILKKLRLPSTPKLMAFSLEAGVSRWWPVSVRRQ